MQSFAAVQDPREYLPFLRALRALPPSLQRHQIDDHLGRHASALGNLAQAGDEHFDDAVRYAAKHSLWEVAHQVYEGESSKYEVRRRQESRSALSLVRVTRMLTYVIFSTAQTILCAHAEDLFDKSNYPEAALRASFSLTALGFSLVRLTDSTSSATQCSSSATSPRRRSSPTSAPTCGASSSRSRARRASSTRTPSRSSQQTSQVRVPRPLAHPRVCALTSSTSSFCREPLGQAAPCRGGAGPPRVRRGRRRRCLLPLRGVVAQRGHPLCASSLPPSSCRSALLTPHRPRPQATLHDRLDLVESRVKSSTLELQQRLLDDFVEMQEQLDKQISRLSDLKSKYEENPCASFPSFSPSSSKA